MSQSSHIIIVGAGLSGLTMALAIARPGLSVTVLDPQPPETMLSSSFDGRTTALAHASKQLYQTLGVWPKLADDAGEILDIRIVDSDSPLYLHYDHKDVGTDPMGYIVENRKLRKILLEAAQRHEHITLTTASFTSATTSGHAIEIQTDKAPLVGALLIAADGKFSRVREQAAIPVKTYDYHQTSIVLSVSHTKHHGNIAIEKFLPSGPFAILPMGKIQQDNLPGYQSSIVWTERKEEAEQLLSLSPEMFLSALEQRFGDYLGAITLASPVWHYPLSLSFAERYHAPRTALIGDAAHSIHPIAGQGFNLGVRDIATLSELLVDSWHLGLDLGSTTYLEKYERLRRLDNSLMIAATDGLNRLFSNDITPVKIARQLGLSAVEHAPKLKEQLIKHAMGIRTKAPKMLEGEPV